MKYFFRRRTLYIFILLGVCGAGYYYYWHHTHPPVVAAVYKTPEEAKSVYVRFDMEGYDIISQNFWKQANDAAYSQLFQLSLQKATGQTETLATTTRTGVAEMLASAFAAATSTDAEKQIAVMTLQVALYNLAPTGHSQLFSAQQVTNLQNEVDNVNPSTNLYQNLGLAKGATVTQVNQAYQQQSQALANATSTQAKQQLQQVTYAHEVLSNQNSKTMYDQAQVEPTVFSHILGQTLYLDISKIAPTTLQEFALDVDAASTTPLNSMIIDLRGNIGGDLDFTAGFLGLFFGTNQYAFDLYHQGNYEVQRTDEPQFSELARFRNIAVLTDNMTQSTAELTAASMQRFRTAVLVGTTTRGWGSVEKTYPMTTTVDPNETYSLLLVTYLTLRDDNQPIEGNGVVPDIDTSVAGWQNKLSSYFTVPSIMTALRTAAVQPPMQ